MLGHPVLAAVILGAGLVGTWYIATRVPTQERVLEARAAADTKRCDDDALLTDRAAPMRSGRSGPLSGADRPERLALRGQRLADGVLSRYSLMVFERSSSRSRKPVTERIMRSMFARQRAGSLPAQ